MGQKGARVELPIQLCRAVTPPTVRFAPPTLSYVPPSVVRFDCFLASKRTLSTAGSQRHFEFEDFLVLKFLFARFAKDNHHLTWHFAPPTRAAESIGFSSDSGVGIFMSTPTPAPTPTCLEWMALCCSHVEHSYARHLIAGQKLHAGGSSVAYMFVCFSGIKRIIDTYDQMQWVPACVYSRPGRAQNGSSDGSLHSITEPFLRSR